MATLVRECAEVTRPRRWDVVFVVGFSYARLGAPPSLRNQARAIDCHDLDSNLLLDFIYVEVGH